MSKRGGRVERLARWIVTHPWVVLAATLVIILTAGAGVTQLGFTTNYRVFFGQDNPDLAAFEKVQAIYTKNDNILLVVTPESGEVFDAATIRAIGSLTEGAWQIPYAIRVDSVTNFQHSRAEADDLIVADLIEDPASPTHAELAFAKRVALERVELVNRVIAPDSDVAGVNVTLQLPGEDPMEVFAAAGAARELAAAIEDQFPYVNVRLTGLTMLNNAFAESGVRDMKTLIPIMYVGLLLAMGLLLRSFWSTIGTVSVVALSAVGTMGLAGWLGWKLDPVSAQAPTMILTLAIADSIHVLVTTLQKMRNGSDRRSALVESLRLNFVAITLTSVTTVVGFLSMNFSDSPPLGQLGTLTAIGVSLAFLLSILFLPALMSVLPLRAPAASKRPRSPAFDRLGEFVVARKNALLVASVVVAALLIAMLPTNRVDDRFVHYFDESMAFRQDSDYTVDHLTGVYQMQFSIDSGKSGGVNSPEYLETLDAFTGWLRDEPAVLHVSSLSDTMRRLNMNLHADDPAYFRLPEDRDLAAQYMLLYEMSLPYGLDINNQVNVDKSSTQVVVTVGNMSSSTFLELAERAETWLVDNAPESMHARATGPAVMFSRISRRNVQSMIVGTLLAFGLITLVLTLALRSVKIGLLSLIPNVIPAATAFGVWALLVGEIGFAVSVVAALTIGIVVDDSVHFLTKYLVARREERMSPPDAVRYAFGSVGRALWITSAVLVAGFAILAQSTFKQNGDLGLLSAVTIAIALMADFFMLPGLLLLVDRQRGERTVTASLKPVQRRATMKHSTSVATVLILALFAALPVSADALEQRGLEIALEADRRDLGFGDYTADLTMVLRNKHDEESVRSLTTRVLEQEADGDKSLVVFDKPADIDGTALLTFSHNTGNDDQWLYLPALKRVKRISSSNKSGPFVGSEFAYEDISSQEIEEYTYRFIREETLDGVPMFVVEQYPTDPKSGYTRQVTWRDQQEYRLHKIEFYDRKDSLLKTLTYTGYEQFLGQYWRPATMSMVNHQTGKSTVLNWTNYAFQSGLTDADFNRATLARAR
ncbi:MAG: outer membrane lipoprotein-sorting protein [Acidobacteria bacterium]|nr:outer membrane lipoprotein-sorting protein [Acidobacteriota bacterium]NIM63061.1 outer membrane lipoprotein-sorting protein [Acidobacteriota bacterium]NIO59938.1 outer membrane lipoprotein-sorting protein [Acidobacteriota bacterium]NIQ31005.1 outer membrane lipoprotein-sorting protein [Acidobacteriota bacterium]NIQ86133.1 outer membrane lipoprotein-sorting protein [Acidobacteriota bacterium]